MQLVPYSYASEAEDLGSAAEEGEIGSGDAAENVHVAAELPLFVATKSTGAVPVALKEGEIIEDREEEGEIVEQVLYIPQPSPAPRTVPNRSNKCQVCFGSRAIYKCPRCLTGTCSAKCSKAHKEGSDCSGRRSRTHFVPLNSIRLEDDARLLQEVDSVVDCAKRKRRSRFFEFQQAKRQLKNSTAR